jgi:translocation and assembly module TamB
VQLGGHLQDSQLSATGSADGVRFVGSARLEGRSPYELKADLDLPDLLRLAPGASAPGLRAQARGTVVARGFLDDADSFRAELRLDPLRGGYGDVTVESREPVRAAIAQGRIVFEPFTLRGAHTEFTLSGAVAGSGALDLAASGALDMRLFGGLFPKVTRLHGRLELSATVAGSFDAPLLVGSGQVRDAGFQVKALPLTLSGASGDLAFSQNRVLFDGVAGAVNGGRAVFRGDLALSRLSLADLRIDAELDEVPVRIPEYLPAVVTGRLSASGKPDATTLTGKLHVVQARYTEKLDLERSMLELRRRPPPPVRVYDKEGEWLRLDVLLVVDGDARIENDVVLGGVKGELVLTGNLAAMGLVGSLSMAEGGRVTFRGNEFGLKHAVVEFTDRHRVNAVVDAQGEAQVREYQVFMSLSGNLWDPKLALTSAPALSQPDLITLLSLGFTTRDAVAGRTVGGAATAAAAQALFSVSGLDEQVKRFMPRAGILRDFSLRITSAYSEGTGQVEPRAEFESRTAAERLRLRYQAPLAGARGQRAQAELKLNQHTSVQYQWDNDNPEVGPGGDHGVDLKLRWEWND